MRTQTRKKQSEVLLGVQRVLRILFKLQAGSAFSLYKKTTFGGEETWTCGVYTYHQNSVAGIYHCYCWALITMHQPLFSGKDVCYIYMCIIYILYIYIQEPTVYILYTLYIYASTYHNTHIYVYMCVCVCVYVCVYMSYVCIHVCIYILYMYINIIDIYTYYRRQSAMLYNILKVIQEPLQGIPYWYNIGA